MDKYTIYCTEEQTKTALELGAPINLDYHKDDFENSIKIRNLCYAEVPTAEQMIGFIDDISNVRITIAKQGKDEYRMWVRETCEPFSNLIAMYTCKSRKEATLAAIDAALEYLM